MINSEGTKCNWNIEYLQDGKYSILLVAGTDEASAQKS